VPSRGRSYAHQHQPTSRGDRPALQRGWPEDRAPTRSSSFCGAALDARAHRARSWDRDSRPRRHARARHRWTAVSDFEGFHRAFSALLEDHAWHGNLDAFNDILRGGSGRRRPGCLGTRCFGDDPKDKPALPTRFHSSDAASRAASRRRRNSALPRRIMRYGRCAARTRDLLLVRHATAVFNDERPPLRTARRRQSSSRRSSSRTRRSTASVTRLISAASRSSAPGSVPSQPAM
jgi:hypothetical protein